MFILSLSLAGLLCYLEVIQIGLSITYTLGGFEYICFRMWLKVQIFIKNIFVFEYYF